MTSPRPREHASHSSRLNTDLDAMAVAAAEHRDGRNSPEVAKGYSPGDVLILTNLQALAALSKGDQARAVRPRTVMPEAE